MEGHALVAPMKGDGEHARRECRFSHMWGLVMPPSRKAMVEARYKDWKEARDAGN